ncbi:efflux RND transporter periplasmic adaptor subunit [Shewanella sedimentimangrovi]|uniref:Efflux RND transporter periplasmic adaptor subunit n=1 Tax=Shewanella sedimentimangrovi TaxID=2814293 RepID=A0ABX7R4L3_9GAMM|nr:efflux RND transporter periplasmic adaptor subunit [Shewanella sedimentimangrovi]QSX38776.1 efflux RND transporter periplasmic adaptor subunit [Shewanella sedimentimangrovi]
MKKIITVLVLGGLAWAGFQYLQQNKGPEAKRARIVPNVVVATAAMQAVRDEVEALGTTLANESVNITAKVTEVVASVNFNDGDLVAKGELLVQLQDAEQRAKVTVAKVKVSDHQRELKRISTLVTNQTVAETERDRLQTAIDTAKAELDQAESALRDRRIVAPFAGRLGLRQISNGALLTPGTSITTLDDISSVKLDFSVPERFLTDLIPGKDVEASAVAYPGELFIGKVLSVDSRVNPATRAVTVRAEIPNPQAKLLPGMLMKVKLIKQSREALLVPESAIIPIQKKHFVYLVNGDNRVEQRQVTVGLRKRGWVELTDGIEMGEKIIIRGILKVRPGDEVKPEQEEHFGRHDDDNGETAA